MLGIPSPETGILGCLKMSYKLAINMRDTVSKSGSRAGSLAQWLKYLPGKYKVLSLIPCTKIRKEKKNLVTMTIIGTRRKTRVKFLAWARSR